MKGSRDAHRRLAANNPAATIACIVTALLVTWFSLFGPTESSSRSATQWTASPASGEPAASRRSTREASPAGRSPRSVADEHPAAASSPKSSNAKSKNTDTKTAPKRVDTKQVDSKGNQPSGSLPKVTAKAKQAAADRVHATRMAKLLRGSPPANLDELKTLQKRIRELTPQIIPATVAIQVGRANGSGVIIDAEGHVLTAAHVAGSPGRNATIFLSNGKIARGTTLGMNQKLDAGMIRITEAGPWPFAPLGNSANVLEGQWCLATGHPGGFDPDRPPVLRWGRVLKTDGTAILSDCTLVGGDSGGPLFDLQGEVIGIHSRIGKNLTINVHVPIDPYRQSWDRLVSGEAWGILEEADEDSAAGWLGVVEDPNAQGATVLRIAPDSPAAVSGIQPGDRILRINEVDITTFAELQNKIRQHVPGAMLQIELDRGGVRMQMQLTLAARPASAE